MLVEGLLRLAPPTVAPQGSAQGSGQQREQARRATSSKPHQRCTSGLAHAILLELLHLHRRADPISGARTFKSWLVGGISTLGAHWFPVNAPLFYTHRLDPELRFCSQFTCTIACRLPPPGAPAAQAPLLDRSDFPSNSSFELWGGLLKARNIGLRTMPKLFGTGVACALVRTRLSRPQVPIGTQNFPGSFFPSSGATASTIPLDSYLDGAALATEYPVPTRNLHSFILDDYHRPPGPLPTSTLKSYGLRSCALDDRPLLVALWRPEACRPSSRVTYTPQQLLAKNLGRVIRHLRDTGDTLDGAMRDLFVDVVYPPPLPFVRRLIARGSQSPEFVDRMSVLETYFLSLFGSFYTPEDASAAATNPTT